MDLRRLRLGASNDICRTKPCGFTTLKMWFKYLPFEMAIKLTLAKSCMHICTCAVYAYIHVHEQSKNHISLIKQA